MGKNQRIQAAGGRWAAAGWGGEVAMNPWISEEMVAKWRLAAAADKSAASSKASSADPLAEALAAVEELGGFVVERSVVDAATPEALLLADAKLALCKERFLAGDESHAYPRVVSQAMERTGRRDLQAWEGVERHCEFELRRLARVSRQVRFVAIPSVNWVAAPGEATLFEPGKAREMIRLAAAAARLRKALPRARAKAAALGFPEGSGDQPMFENLPVGCKELAGARAATFDAAEEFESKACFAIYVDQEPAGKKGFLDKDGRVKNDLGQACLFPDKKLALAFARKRHLNCHFVELVASVVGFGTLLGNPASPADLGAVIAARERREIEKVLGSARQEELEAELARRKEALPEAKPTARRL